ncbi:MAG: MgtC/SapB family protein, partial [Alphaproteobacteria bacterium]
MGLDPASLGLLLNLAVALGIGLLIGVERGWHARDREEGQRVAGFRTFGLIGLLGGIAGIVDREMLLLPAAAMLAIAGFFALAYREAIEDDQRLGITTEVAALVTFGLGVMCGRGILAPAASAAIVMALILGFKPEMHGLIRRIDRRELLATLRLLLISVVFLSVLPNEGFGPWNA